MNTAILGWSKLPAAISPPSPKSTPPSTISTNRPEPSLTRICLLARRRDNLVNRNKDIPERLLGTWIHLGRVNRAYATAQSMPDRSQCTRALTHIFETLAETGQIDRAEALVIRCPMATHATPHWPISSGPSPRLVPSIAPKPLQARSRATEHAPMRLVNITQALAEGGDIKRAEGIADQIRDDQRHTEALESIIQAAAAAVPIEHAQALADTHPDEYFRADAIAQIGWITAEAGDYALATRLGDRAERLCPPVPDDQTLMILVAIAATRTLVGDIERARSARCQPP